MNKTREALNAALAWLPSDIQDDINNDEHFEKSKNGGVYPKYIKDIATIRAALKSCSNCGSDNVRDGYCIACSFRQ